MVLKLSNKARFLRQEPSNFHRFNRRVLLRSYSFHLPFWEVQFSFWERPCGVWNMWTRWPPQCCPQGITRNVLIIKIHRISVLQRRGTCAVCKVFHGWSRGEKNEELNSAPDPKKNKQCSCRLSWSSEYRAFERCRAASLKERNFVYSH